MYGGETKQMRKCTGPGYPFLWGHPVVPIYGDISKNRHITAYGKGANIAFLVYACKTAKSYMVKTFSWDFKGEIMQQLIQFGSSVKKNYDARYVIQFFNKKKLSDFCDIPYHLEYLYKE